MNRITIIPFILLFLGLLFSGKYNEILEKVSPKLAELCRKL